MKSDIIDKPLEAIANEKNVITAIETAFELGFNLGNTPYSVDYQGLCDLAYDYLDALKTNVLAYLKRRTYE